MTARPGRTTRRRAATQAAALTALDTPGGRLALLAPLTSSTPMGLAFVTWLAGQPARSEYAAWLRAFADDPRPGVYKMARLALLSVYHVPPETLPAPEGP